MGHSFYENSKTSDRKQDNDVNMATAFGYASLGAAHALRSSGETQKDARDLKERLSAQHVDNGLWVVQPFERTKSPVKHQVMREHSL
jgi:hypothetical protein